MKPDRTIQRESMAKYLRELISHHRRYARTGDVERLLEARSYADEALEHASLMRDGGKSVKRVEKIIDRVLGRADARVPAHRLPSSGRFGGKKRSYR